MALESAGVSRKAGVPPYPGRLIATKGTPNAWTIGPTECAGSASKYSHEYVPPWTTIINGMEARLIDVRGGKNFSPVTSWPLARRSENEDMIE